MNSEGEKTGGSINLFNESKQKVFKYPYTGKNVEKRARKNFIIIVIILAIILVVAIAIYFFVFNNNQGFSFTKTPDFSSGVGAMDKATSAGNANAFENTKLNPFENSS